MIEIVPYNELWPLAFAEIGAALRTALGDLAVRIDHIGSTSVPGLDAKDIIDVQVTVPALEPFMPIQTAVASLGYTWRDDITTDHRPPGDTSPEAEWRKWYFAPPPGQRPTHLHVRAAGRANQRYPLLFRDYLRTHPQSAAGYAALKYRLAEYHGRRQDHAPYSIIKDPVCDIIMSAAEDWAEATNWQPDPSDV